MLDIFGAETKQHLVTSFVNYRALYGTRLENREKTTCKRSRTRSQELLSTLPFFVGYFTKLGRVNNRFCLEPVLVSTWAVPSLLTSKRAWSQIKHWFLRRRIIRVSGERPLRAMDSWMERIVIYDTKAEASALTTAPALLLKTINKQAKDYPILKKLLMEEKRDCHDVPGGKPK